MGFDQQDRGFVTLNAMESIKLAWLQWGHDKGVVEGAMAGPVPSPARNSLQWGHDKGVVEGVSGTALAAGAGDCFNGATTKESWKA
ncbi:MAG: hypothetical protein ACHRXM_38110 [Isosphaerales bacterium]